MAKTPISGLSDAISKILTEYAEEITGKMDEVVPRVARAGVKALKQNAAVFTVHNEADPYKNSWKSKVERGRLQTTATIYSAKPGLPHLLEYGHATRNGGRVGGQVHIEPVEREIIEEFEKEVEKAIK